MTSFRLSVPRLLRGALLIAGIAYILVFAILAILRLYYPYEIEWMEGAMMDHAVRVLHGKSLYAAPTLEFVPWLYPPLYYYAISGMMLIFGDSYFGPRLLSILLAFAIALLCAVVARKLTSNSFLAFLTGSLFIASYGATGYFFDLVRNDVFLTFLLAAILALLVSRVSIATVVGASLLTITAFFTKQQTVFFAVPVTLWLWSHRRFYGYLFVGIVVGISLLSYGLLQYSTHGWYAYYTLAIPHAKEAYFDWLRAFRAIPLYAMGVWAPSSIALLIAIHYLFRDDNHERWTSSRTLVLYFFFAALASAIISIGNEGGYRNVLMQFSMMSAIVLTYVSAELLSRSPASASIVHGAILFQFLALFYNPLGEKIVVASARQRQGGEHAMQILAAIPGDVYISRHGYITHQLHKPMHAHFLAALDVLRMQDTNARNLMGELNLALEQHKFGAVVEDESPVFNVDSISDYQISGRLNPVPNVFLSRISDDATRPQYLFLPK